MNVYEIKTSRYSEASAPHKKGCLISFTVIHLQEKGGGGGGGCAIKIWILLDLYYLKLFIIHFLLQSGSILPLLQFNAFSALPFISH